MATALGKDADAADYRALAASIADRVQRRASSTRRPRATPPRTRGHDRLAGAGRACRWRWASCPPTADAVGARRSGRAHRRLPPQRRRPAHQRRRGLAAADLPRADGRTAATTCCGTSCRSRARPSYANFVNQGRTTIPEFWDFAGSQNHMILLQIDEWFNAGLAGIGQAAGLGRLRPRRHQAAGRRRPHARRRQLRHAARHRRAASGPRTPTGVHAEGHGARRARPRRSTCPPRADEIVRRRRRQRRPRSAARTATRCSTCTRATSRSSAAPAPPGRSAAPCRATLVADARRRRRRSARSRRACSAVRRRRPRPRRPRRAGDAALSVSGPAHADQRRVRAATAAARSPACRDWSAPVSNDAVTIGFRQTSARPTRCAPAAYTETLTFTLSTTTP